MAEDPERLRTGFRQLAAEEMASTKPRCLIHGDSHLGNTCALPDGSRLWFDWQLVRRGRPWRDYSYFVAGSLSVDDRRRREADLMRIYCEAMASRGVELDVGECFDEYRRWIFWGLWAWQSNMNPIETTMEPLERFCIAAEDLETHTFFQF
jgi:aminoglycoside phosphotransferase (APT) family kinase protein